MAQSFDGKEINPIKIAEGYLVQVTNLRSIFVHPFMWFFSCFHFFAPGMLFQLLLYKMLDLFVAVRDLFLKELIGLELLLQPKEIVRSIVTVERPSNFFFWLSAVVVPVFGQTLWIKVALTDILNDLHPCKSTHILDHYVQPKVQ